MYLRCSYMLWFCICMSITTSIFYSLFCWVLFFFFFWLWVTCFGIFVLLEVVLLVQKRFGSWLVMYLSLFVSLLLKLCLVFQKLGIIQFNLFTFLIWVFLLKKKKKIGNLVSCYCVSGVGRFKWEQKKLRYQVRSKRRCWEIWSGKKQNTWGCRGVKSELMTLSN